MNDSLLSLIQRAIEMKTGNKEFELCYWDEAPESSLNGPWSASIGNPHTSVNIGEGGAEFTAYGNTPEAAVSALVVLLSESD